LKGLSISVISLEIVKRKIINFFILSVGDLEQSLNRIGAAPKPLAYVYKIDSGFIAKTGKLIPIKDPVDKNFFSTNFIIFP
jgi:hypothetical protein